jgi:hypothetical protein
LKSEDSVSRSYIDTRRIIGVETKIDKNGVPYITVIIEDRGTGDELTLRMNVNQAKRVSEKILEAEKEAVNILKKAGYEAWPTRFV